MRPAGNAGFPRHAAFPRTARSVFPANRDCKSACFWSDGRLHLLTSNQRPSLSSGPDLERLGQAEPYIPELAAAARLGRQGEPQRVGCD